MNNKTFIKGSEWRKWDLHVHTPKSIIQNYGGDTPQSWEKFIADLESLPSDYKVLGINDYIFLDGYQEVCKYKAEGRLSNIDLILPVIELRIDRFASQGNEAWKKVNFHIIFSNTLDPKIIQAQFLNAIPSKATLYPTGEELQGYVTYDFLEEFGRQVIEASDVPINDKPRKVGFKNLVFDYGKVKEALKSSGFKGKYLTAVGKSEWDKMRWDGSAASKKTIVNEADFLFNALNSAADYGKHVASLKEKNVNSRLLDCSDAHDYSSSSNKDRIGNSFTWLKSDSTFEGLKQVANDVDRIFVGDIPPLLKRLKENKTKYIKKLKFGKIGSKPTSGWFTDFELPLNPSMVAIIGNKGNGKSAITDSIGLAGNTPNYEYFSFLNSKKFRRRKPLNHSESFEASIEWEDGTKDTSKLCDNPSPTSLEKIKYIPQGFLEKLCNDNIEDFEQELREVIFSHLSKADRLGKTSLDEIIEYKTQVLTNEIEELKKAINTDNRKIVELEQKNTVEYRSGIEEKLKQKENELQALKGLKPVSVMPSTNQKIIEKNKEASNIIKLKKEELNSLEHEIKSKNDSQGKLKVEITELDKVSQSIDVFEGQFLKLKEEIGPVLTKSEIDFNEIISLLIDRSKLNELILGKKKQSESIEKDLSVDQEGSIEIKKNNLLSEIDKLQNTLDEHPRKYQKYLDDLKKWDEKIAGIIGTPDQENTIEYFKSQISYLETELTSTISEMRNSRLKKVTILFEKKDEIISLYKTLFEPISSFISKYGGALEEYNIKLDVNYRIKGFTEKFFDHISFGAKGSFIGSKTGTEQLAQILENHTLTSESGIINFLNEITTYLFFDQRPDYHNKKREIDKQLKKGYTVYDLYSFLFSLDYLVPEYRLKLGNKNISELSPGERGALLLIFYLTIDKKDIPLIIDQPEENLDNQSVFKILVKFIKKAKEKRQIILVTHNPNLAVACGAEQIVHVAIDKKNKNSVSYISGSLESEEINNAVIDILEGTFPALNTRTNTYEIIVRK